MSLIRVQLRIEFKPFNCPSILKSKMCLNSILILGNLSLNLCYHSNPFTFERSTKLVTPSICCLLTATTTTTTTSTRTRTLTRTWMGSAPQPQQTNIIRDIMLMAIASNPNTFQASKGEFLLFGTYHMSVFQILLSTSAPGISASARALTAGARAFCGFGGSTSPRESFHWPSAKTQPAGFQSGQAFLSTGQQQIICLWKLFPRRGLSGGTTR